MRLILLLIFIGSFTIYSCNSSSEKVQGAPDSLLGSWKLVADQQVDSLGKVVLQDTSVSGLIIYTPEGKMSVQWLCYGTRNPIMNDSIMSYDGVSYGTGFGKNTWTVEQARTIIDTYDAYFGDYTIDRENQVITHVVTGNLRPEKIEKTYNRKFQLKGDTLLLRDTNPAMYWQAAWVRIVK
jgi:Lipocalin-like domain